jgi:hypothetical protein
MRTGRVWLARCGRIVGLRSGPTSSSDVETPASPVDSPDSSTKSKSQLTGEFTPAANSEPMTAVARLCVGFFVLLAAVAVSSPIQAGQIPALTGANTLTSEGTGWVDVRIPAGARIDLRRQLLRKQGPNSGFSIKQGTGAFAGLILESADRASVSDRIVLGQFNPCDSAACTLPVFNYVSPAEGSVRFDTGEKTPRFLPLREGRYRLWVVGEETTTVKLDLRGLQGTQTITARDEAAADVKHLPSQLGTRGGDTTFAAGATFNSGSQGILIANLFVKAKGVESFDWGICAYNGPDAPPEMIAYGPHCTVLVRAMGAGFSGQFAGLKDGYFVAQFSTTYAESHFPPNVTGRRGLGAWYVTPSEGVLAAGAQGVYINMPDL